GTHPRGADPAVGEPGHPAAEALPALVLACRAVNPIANSACVGPVVRLGSPPNPVGAWTAVPDSGARRFRTRPSPPGANATVLWSRTIPVDILNRICLPGR